MEKEVLWFIQCTQDFRVCVPVDKIIARLTVVHCILDDVDGRTDLCRMVVYGG